MSSYDIIISHFVNGDSNYFICRCYLHTSVVFRVSVPFFGSFIVFIFSNIAFVNVQNGEM